MTNLTFHHLTDTTRKIQMRKRHFPMRRSQIHAWKWRFQIWKTESPIMGVWIAAH